LQQKQLDDDAKDAVNEMKADIETGLIPSEDVIKSRLARVKGTKKSLSLSNTVELWLKSSSS
jgi:hypothetical protein